MKRYGTLLRISYLGHLPKWTFATEIYFQGVYCNAGHYRFYITLQHHRPLFYTICGVVIQPANSLEITLILQLALSGVKIGPPSAYGNGLMLSP